MNIPATCLEDFEQFKSLVGVKIHRLNTKIDLLSTHRKTNTKSDAKLATQKLQPTQCEYD